MRILATGTSSLARPCAALIVGLAILAAPRPAAALSPAPDLPPGSFHELRITSLTALTVAQQITQPSICSNGNVCLHNEIRRQHRFRGRPDRDRRARAGGQGNPVLPTHAKASSSAQSGPADAVCAAGEKRRRVGGGPHIGTIDQGNASSSPGID
jgi:hypothetical protein